MTASVVPEKPQPSRTRGKGVTCIGGKIVICVGERDNGEGRADKEDFVPRELRPAA